VVLCVGLDATIEGEEGDTGNAFAAGDKMDLYLPRSQRTLVERILALNKPTIVVVSAGSAINPLSDSANAIIHAWYPGQLGGRALANIIFGDVSPSGKLPVTFYKNTDLLPDFEDYSMKNRTYRHLENNVLYPFGFGLTYSKVVCKSVAFDHETQMATVCVENMGPYDTDEVIQLYIKDNQSKWAVLNYKLCGFKRIHLKCGEQTDATFAIQKDAFEVVDDQGKKYLDSHSFTLFAGVSQPDKISLALTGNTSISCHIEI
jgi:beta-glucosidase